MPIRRCLASPLTFRTANSYFPDWGVVNNGRPGPALLSPQPSVYQKPSNLQLSALISPTVSSRPPPRLRLCAERSDRLDVSLAATQAGIVFWKLQGKVIEGGKRNERLQETSAHNAQATMELGGFRTCLKHRQTLEQPETKETTEILHDS